MPGIFRRAKASNTGPAEARLYANTGVHIGDVVLQPPARSTYLEQVRRIAPEQLLDRDEELAELARFCTSPDQAGYAWWRAPAWAGKTALMSWFVLHPPPEVQVVSFFVTARYAGQDSRTAFIDAMLEQLAASLNQSVPAYATEATREAHLLSLFTEAAKTCTRLILVVDGLDEDRGATTNDSIAQLLPKRLPENMRVIVASRPNPPAEDVGVVHTLTTSPHATVVRDDMERELKRILHGTPEEQDLLGLLTAASGGLSSADLAELVGEPEWRVQDRLKAVAGRTFTRRASQWRPGVGPDVYILGHEELQRTAVQYLGDRLVKYRERLHGWADAYRERGWPEDTPEYLLRGYFRMLEATQDVDRVLACATDPVRRARMLAMSGGDAAALAEIITAEGMVPDLPAAARLAVHRVWVRERNVNLPADLAVVWAALGQSSRAEALVGAIEDVGVQGQAVTALVAHGWADLATDIVRSTGNLDLRWSLLVGLAYAGDLDRATRLAEEVEAGLDRDRALMNLATAMLELKESDRCHALAVQIVEPWVRGWILACVAQAHASAGNQGQAGAILAEAEAALDLVTNPDLRSQARIDLVPALAVVRTVADAEEYIAVRLEEQHRAAATAKLAVAVAGWLGDFDHGLAIAWTLSESMRLDTLAELAEIAVDADDWTRAELIAQSVETADSGKALAKVGLKYARAGDFDRAEVLIRSIGRQWDLADLAVLVAESGQVHRAEALIRSVATSGNHAAKIEVVRQLARAGEIRRAGALAVDVPGGEAEALLGVIEPLHQAGDTALALDAANQVVGWYPTADVLATLAKELVLIGAQDRARDIAESAENLARSTADPEKHAEALGHLVISLVAANELTRATAVVSLITVPEVRDAAALRLVHALADAGSPAAANDVAESIRDLTHRSEALGMALVASVAAQENLDEALEMARAVESEPTRTEACAAVMLSAAERDDGSPMSFLYLLDVKHLSAKTAARIAMAFVQREKWHQCKEFVLRLVGYEGHAKSVTAAVQAMAAAGAVDAAVDILASVVGSAHDEMLIVLRTVAYTNPAEADRLVENMSTRARARAGVGVVLAGVAAAQGDFDRAERLATRITEDDQRTQAIGSVVRQLTAAGHLTRAESLAPMIVDDSGQSETVADLAVAIAAEGRVDRAEALAKTIIDPADRTEALTAVVRARVAAGEFAIAEALAGTVPDGRHALAAVVGGLAAAGNTERAEALMWSARDPEFRAHAAAALMIAAMNNENLEPV